MRRTTHASLYVDLVQSADRVQRSRGAGGTSERVRQSKRRMSKCAGKYIDVENKAERETENNNKTHSVL